MSLIDQIMLDVQGIINESKKHAPVKQVQLCIMSSQLAQQTIEPLKQMKSSGSNSQIGNNHSPQLREHFPSSLILKLLQQIVQIKFEPKSPQLWLHAVSLLQKVGSLNVIEPAHIVQCLYMLREVADDQMQLKLVQCALQLVGVKQPEVYEKLLSVLFMLSCSRNGIVQSTSITGTFQLINGLFEDKSKVPENLFMDLIKGMQGQKVVWIQGNTKGLCRDLLIEAVKILGQTILQNEHLTRLVSDYISPLVYEEMALDDLDTRFNARRIRAAFILILYLRRDIPLVKHLGSLFLRSPSHHYLRYWILEGFSELLSNSEIVLMLHLNPEESSQTQQLGQHFSYLQHIVHLIISAVEDETPGTPIKTNQKQVKILESNTLDYSETPQYTPGQFQKISIDCILALSEQLQAIVKENQVILGNKNFKITRDQQQKKDLSSSVEREKEFSATIKENSNRFTVIPDSKIVFGIIDGTWVMMLKIIKKLLKVQSDERVIQNILNVLQNYINIGGSIGQIKARDQFLSFLTSQCIADHPTDGLSSKNLQASQTLFNIAYCLGPILDVNSWFIVLQTLHKFEGQLSKKLDTNPQEQELIDMQNVLEGLFNKSHLYDDAQLLQVMDALNQVTLQVMESSTTSGQHDIRALLFCFSKITHMVYVNWHRVTVFWEFVAAYYSCIMNCKEAAFRQPAAESFCQLIQEGFNYFQKAYSAKVEDEEELSPALKKPTKHWNRKNWQCSLLQPMYEVVKVQFGNTRQQLLQGLLRLLQNNGHEFQESGFMSVIDILKLCCESDVQDNSYVVAGFHVLELVIQQYLHALNPTITKILLPLINSFRAKTQEPNISFISVGLIWQLADNLSKQKIPHDELEDLWSAVLINLKDLCLDEAPDVRQSALHIIAQVTLINCAAFRIDYQISLFRDVLMIIFDALIGRVAQLQKQQAIFHIQTPKFLNDSQTPKFTKFSEETLNKQKVQEPQWEETLKLMVQCLAKIVKKLQGIQGYENYSQNVHNEVFVRLFVLLRFNNLDLKLEVSKFIREVTQIIVEKGCDRSLEWSKDLIAALNEFLFQKFSDQRDQKIMINKILPEFCETFVQLSKAYTAGLKFQDNFFDEMLECYQQIIDQPSKIGNVNIKLWFDDKYLHDYAADFAQCLQDEALNKLLMFLLKNLKKPINLHPIIDMIIKRFTQVFADSVVKTQAPDDLIKEYVNQVEAIIDARRENRLLAQVKVYNNSILPLWNSCSLPLQQVLNHYHNLFDLRSIAERILSPIELNEMVSSDALRSCSDLELQWCAWAVKIDPSIVVGYWKMIQSGYVYTDELLYETRKQVIAILLAYEDDASIIVIEDLVNLFIKEEQLSGSMGLARARVQEVVHVLNSVKQLRGSKLLHLMMPLTQLILSKENEIKGPLQEIFVQIALEVNDRKDV